ncbi:hypothetical protein [Neorhizobium galegae]|uniref:hypothetical protein n=1 Tax=Neorhizobium galegae TaxID=399 RepID=UPI000627BEB8|nr:hypothetical protein [Neorhizobium galegae]
MVIPPMMEFALISRDMIFASVARDFATGQFANGGNVPDFEAKRNFACFQGLNQAVLRSPKQSDLGSQFARRSE